MPHTPKKLFGKPPLSVCSPLSSFGMEEGCRMRKRIRACPPLSHTASAGLSLLGITASARPQAHPTTSTEGTQPLGKMFFQWKEFR